MIGQEAVRPDGSRSHPAWSSRLDSRRGAIINHDGARLDEPQGGVPEGAAGLFPVGYRVSPARELATYRYAAIEQAPSYVGAPMLSALLPVYAARAVNPTWHATLLEQGYGDFINPPFLEPDELPRDRVDRPRASPMFANLSGFLTVDPVRIYRPATRAGCARYLVGPECRFSRRLARASRRPHLGTRGAALARQRVRPAGRGWRAAAR